MAAQPAARGQGFFSDYFKLFMSDSDPAFLRNSLLASTASRTRFRQMRCVPPDSQIGSFIVPGTTFKVIVSRFDLPPVHTFASLFRPPLARYSLHLNCSSKLNCTSFCMCKIYWEGLLFFAWPTLRFDNEFLIISKPYLTIVSRKIRDSPGVAETVILTN